MNSQSLRQGKAKQLHLKTTPFFSEELPQAGFEPTMSCVLGRRSNAHVHTYMYVHVHVHDSSCPWWMYVYLSISSPQGVHIHTYMYVHRTGSVQLHHAQTMTLLEGRGRRVWGWTAWRRPTHL